MRSFLMASLAFFLSACGSYDFVPTVVPELITEVTYTSTHASGSDSWHIDNDSLKVHHVKKAPNGQIISQRFTKATMNDFNLIATALEREDFQNSSSLPAAGNPFGQEKLVVVANSGTRVFTQDSSTRFPTEVGKMTRLIPSLFAK